jgi:hypothetical protein
VGLNGGSTTTLATGTFFAGGIAVNATSVYWGTYGYISGGSGTAGTVNVVPLAGGAKTTLAYTTDPYSVAVDAISVYWNYPVERMPLGGGATVTLAASGANQSFSTQTIAVDASNVYWADPSTGTVNRVPTGGGTPTTLANAQPRGIALDAANVYWTDGTGAIMKVSLGGGSPTTLATGQTNAFGIAVDSTSVYWTNQGVNSTGSVMKLTPK